MDNTYENTGVLVVEPKNQHQDIEVQHIEISDWVTVNFFGTELQGDRETMTAFIVSRVVDEDKKLVFEILKKNDRVVVNLAECGLYWQIELQDRDGPNYIYAASPKGSL